MSVVKQLLILNAAFNYITRAIVIQKQFSFLLNPFSYYYTFYIFPKE